MTHIKKIGAGVALVAALTVIAPSFASAATLYRQLQVGSTGSDVTSLQTFLAQDATLYPSGKITGYFGDLTKGGVVNFQVRNGISAVGRVGPITMAALNAQMGGEIFGVDNSAPVIYSTNATANNSSATVSWSTNEAAQGQVYYSTSPLTVFETLHDVSISGAVTSGDSQLRLSQNMSISGLSSNTTYYYMIYSKDQAGNVSVTWPATFRTN